MLEYFQNVKVLVVGDPHIKTNNIKESEEMIEKLIVLSKEKKPHFVVLLGDILDRHSNIHVIPLMKAEKLVLALSQLTPVFLIIGNHDRPNNSNFLTDEHPFGAMKFWPNTHIIDKTTTYCLNGINFLFVPYVPPGRLIEAINTIPEALKNCHVVFSHQEIKGCQLGAIISTEGDIWGSDMPLMISGHIHDYQKLGDNMIYVGTPIQHTYSENSDKTVSLFNFGLNMNNFSWQEERIDLGLTKKVTVYLKVEDLPNYSPPKDKEIKLVIKGTEAEIKTIAKLEKIQTLKKMGIKIVFKTDEMSLNNSENIKYEFSSKMNYKNRLISELKNDKEAIQWFNKIFNF